MEKNIGSEIKRRLECIEHKQLMFFTWLCAVRMLPFLGAKGNFKHWKEDEIQKHLYSIFDSLDYLYSGVVADAYIAKQIADNNVMKAEKESINRHKEANKMRELNQDWKYLVANTIGDLATILDIAEKAADVSKNVRAGAAVGAAEIAKAIRIAMSTNSRMDALSRVMDHAAEINAATIDAESFENEANERIKAEIAIAVERGADYDSATKVLSNLILATLCADDIVRNVSALNIVRAVNIAVHTCSPCDTHGNVERAYRAFLSADNVARNHNIAVSFEEKILEDIKCIQLGKNEEFCNDVSLYGKNGEIWSNFHVALNGIGCSYWSDLYKDVFESGFKLDREKLNFRLTEIPVEIKEQGAKAVSDFLQHSLVLQGG